MDSDYCQINEEELAGMAIKKKPTIPLPGMSHYDKMQCNYNILAIYFFVWMKGEGKLLLYADHQNTSDGQ